MGRTDYLGKPGILRRLPRWTAAALLLLAGCSSVPDAINPVEWYRSATGLKADDPKPDERNTQNLEAGSKQPYPNLASVPAPPSGAMSTPERERLAASLAADRANAKYTDEELRFGNGSAVLRPTAPAAPARASGPAGAPLSAAPLAASEPAPSAPTAVAAAPAAPAPSPAPAPSAAGSGSHLVAGSALAPSPAPPAAHEEPPQEAPATPPEVRSVPAPETPRAPPPPPRLAGAAAPAGPSVARAEPKAEEPPRKGEQPIVEITFAENSAKLAPADRAAIEEAVARRKETGGTLRVVGYAGRPGGGDAASQQLAGFGMALDRANAVAQALAQAGAPSSDILVEAAPPVAGTGAASRRAQIFVER